MIAIPGSLAVKHITGAKGAFAVGDLSTSIGTFKVKDAMLDQYDEGNYSGTFVISSIYPSSYVYYGRVMTEVRAKLDSIELDEEGVPGAGESSRADPALPVPAEPDPLDEQCTASAESTPSVNAQSAPGDAPAVGGENADADPDVVLFGRQLAVQIRQREPGIKLDPTIERGVFRAQRDRLKQLGYKFDPTGQTWFVA